MPQEVMQSCPASWHRHPAATAPLTQQWLCFLTIVFSKYIMDDMVVLRMMYTVSMDKYRDALMLRKPSHSLLTLLQALTFMLLDRWPCKVQHFRTCSTGEGCAWQLSSST